MDEMQQWEVSDLLKELPYVDSMSWDQTRLLAILIAKQYSKANVQDMLKFPWDVDIRKENDIEMTKEEMEHIKEMEAAFRDVLKNRNNM